MTTITLELGILGTASIEAVPQYYWKEQKLHVVSEGQTSRGLPVRVVEEETDPLLFLAENIIVVSETLLRILEGQKDE